MQSQKVYQPQQAITGAAFSARFKLLATLVSLGLVGYVLSFLLRYPAVSELAQLGLLVATIVAMAPLIRKEVSGEFTRSLVK